jgi:ferrous iron transport protein A
MGFKQFNHACNCLTGKVRQCLRGKSAGQAAPLSATGHYGRKRICKITGDRKLCARMAALGFHPGAEVEVLCQERDARCLLKIQGGTISLDNAATKSIFVESIE